MQPHSFAYVLFTPAFTLQKKKEVVATVTIWPEKPEVLALCVFTVKVRWLLA